jgi:hypothetical protein
MNANNIGAAALVAIAVILLIIGVNSGFEHL